MIRVRGTVSYVGANGAPTLTSEYRLTDKEQEVVDLLALIKAEAGPHASVVGVLHALSVLPNPCPVFTEWVTGGMFTTDALGSLMGLSDAYETVLDHFPGWWNGAS